MCVCVCVHTYKYSFVYTVKCIQFYACVCVCACVAPMCTVHAVVACSSSSSELRLIFTYTHARAHDDTLLPYYCRSCYVRGEERCREISIIYDDVWVRLFGKRGRTTKITGCCAQQQTDRNPKNNIYNYLLRAAIA